MQVSPQSSNLFSWKSGNQESFIISFPPQDTIGAGDSFIAGFLFALAKHRSVVHCIQHGVGSKRNYIIIKWCGVVCGVCDQVVIDD